MLRTSVWILHQCQNVFQRTFSCNIGRRTCATRDRSLLVLCLSIVVAFRRYSHWSRDVDKTLENGQFSGTTFQGRNPEIFDDNFQIWLSSEHTVKFEFCSVISEDGVRKKEELRQNIMTFHAGQHLSYDVCLKVKGKIIRTVLCCIVYWSCAQS